MNAPRTRSALRLFALLWMAGNSLRLTVLAVPPLLPAIHHALHLNEAAVGALTALPVLLLSVGAVPGSLLVARLGARRALVTGLVLVAAGGALRGVGDNTGVLFAMTFVMGIGIAVSQPALPSLVRLWLPERIGPATGAYANGLLTGEVIASALSATVLLPLLGGWNLALAVWSAPVLFTAGAIAAYTPHVPRLAAARRWWPEWRSAITWRLGIVLGSASLSYFVANAFIPDFLRATHHGAVITPALTSINLAQFPASLLVAAVPDFFLRRRWSFVLPGLICLAVPFAFAGVETGVVIWAAILGFSTAIVLVVSLALAPLLVDEHDVHRLTAAVFTISYACPFAGSLVGGALWDATGIAAVAFAPIALSGLAMSALGWGLHGAR